MSEPTELALVSPPIDTNALTSGQALQRVQTQYTGAIAVQKPRVLADIEREVMKEAALIGEAGFYAWGAGTNRIEGPNKELTKVIVRLWGNCAIELGPVQETRDAWIFTPSFVDLETGFTLARQFRQSKRWKVHGQFDEARKEDIRFQIGQTKAVRNLILNVMPAWLVNRALDKAKGGVREKIEQAIEKHGVAEVQTAAIGRLQNLGVPESDVLRVFGRPTVTSLTIEDLVILHGNINALETGADTIETMFPPERGATERKPEKDRTEQLVQDIKKKATQVRKAKMRKTEDPNAPVEAEDPDMPLEDTGPRRLVCHDCGLEWSDPDYAGKPKPMCSKCQGAGIEKT